MCFDINILYDKIDQLDLTKSYIYVLELEDNRYYVGRTCNFIQRMEEHFTDCGSLYTKKYKPIKIVEVNEEKSKYDERDKTLEYMDMYGWKNVRGYAWCSVELINKPKIKKEKEKKELVVSYENTEIRNLYTLENKNIIEIGNQLNKSPGSIAYSLEKMKIVERRQQSRGYMNYVFSDLYKVCKQERDNIRMQNKIKKENKKTINASSKLTAEELINIKEKIRMYFALNDI
jgi:hypothetical protein